LGECQMRVSDLNGLSIAEKSLREETRAQRGYIAQLEARVKESEAEIVERRKDYSESVNKLDAENAILKADLAAVGEGWRVLGDCSPHPQREGGMK
jgi:hypothetical protein